MFPQLTDRLTGTLGKIRGGARFTAENISNATVDIRKALIEADVALPVIKTFIENITQKTIGEQFLKKVRPEEAFIKIVQDELIDLLGAENSALNLRAQKPIVILMAG